MDTLYPTSLKPGDQICIIDPANAFTEEGKRQAAQLLEAQSFHVCFSEDMAFKRGTASERAARLNRVFENPENRGIFCMWGGYGTMNLLELINYSAISEHRPVFAGFSDITAMHTAIYKQTGLVTFHSPALYSPKRPVTPEAAAFFMQMVQSIKTPVILKNLNDEEFQTVHKGKTKGRLVGGNLTIVSRLMGTPYEVETKGNILFLEEVGEKPYRLHGMLMQLKLGGKLQDAAGIIIGSLNDCDDAGRPGSGLDAVKSVLEEVAVPIVCQVRAGHICDPLTLPLGAPAEISDHQIKVF